MTAAYPSPAEPTRAAFLENYLLALRDLGFDITVVAPRVTTTILSSRSASEFE